MARPAVKYASNQTTSAEEARGGAQFGAGCARGSTAALASTRSASMLEPLSPRPSSIFLSPKSACVRFPAADVAAQYDRHSWGFPSFLHERYLALLVAVWTYGMRQFGRLHAVFQGIGFSPIFPVFLQFIPLLVTFPCLKASYFWFQRAYCLVHLRLALAGRQC